MSGAPWLALSPPVPDGPEPATMLDALERAVARGGELLRYGGERITAAEVHARAGAVAGGLAARGVGHGDRVGLLGQNIPEFVYALLGCWQRGAIAVLCSPLLRRRELAFELEDSGAALLIALEPAEADIEVITAGDLAGDGRPEPVEVRPGDVATLTYTSGTTGPPKGAMNTHGNIVHGARAYRDFAALTPDDVILGVAPLFHVTGLVAHVATAVLVSAPLVLTGRFDARAVAALIERDRPTFTVAAITAFTALLDAPGDLSSLARAYSGGAPVSQASAAAWEQRSGHPLRIAYGLSETTSPSHLVPLAHRPPVHPDSGALAVGIPVTETVARILGPDGAELPVGETGEIAIRGPQVVPGYWNRPEETAHALPNGELRTGDVGLMDADGWFYVVDRLKDQINVSGFKVWPREVEDVLYAHPAVREVAVVGVPDAYRGEAVKAVVSLKADVTPEELVAFARERLAAHKYPRRVEIVDELPKTASGKILRRALRG
jgi:long-chain acyl-CoA synthetase